MLALHPAARILGSDMTLRNSATGIFVSALVICFGGHSALAQSTAQPVTPGALVTSGCPGGATTCFMPYSPSNPTPVVGSISTGPAAYSNAITITASVSTTSVALTSAIPSKRLDLFNNDQSAMCWVNPTGGTAVIGQGIPLYPTGGYTWTGGLSAIPTGVCSATAAISGSAG